MDRENVIKDLEEYRDREFVKEGITVFDNDPRYRKLIIGNALALLKEQEKLINVDDLREKLGFAENCEKCKQNSRHCQYDSHFSLMDFCGRLDMAIEELTKTTS